MKITIKFPNGQSVEKITDLSKVVVGRSPRCDFAIADAALSRSHCLIECVNGEFFITDLGSSNGVYLQGERIEPNHRIQFFTYIHLSLASLECQVQDIDEEEMHAYTKTLTASMVKQPGIKPALPKTPTAPATPVAPDEEALIQDILETVKAKESETPSPSSKVEKKLSKEALSSPQEKKATASATASTNKSPPKAPKSIHSSEKNLKLIAFVGLCVVLYFLYNTFLAESPAPLP